MRGLPTEVHAELCRRAAEADKSLRAYLLQVLTEHVAVPSMGEWLDHLRELGPTDVGALSGADLVAAACAEDGELAAR